MVVLLGNWEIGYHAPITEQYYWNLPLRDFKVDEWWMCPVSGIKNSEESKIPLKEAVDYAEAFSKIDPMLQRVFIEPRTDHYNPDTTWLHNFEHPENCVYIFGSAHYNPTLKYKREQDVVVSIKTAEDRGVLWADQCSCIVLYDRFIKGI